MLFHIITILVLSLGATSAPVSTLFSPYSLFDLAFNATWSIYWDWNYQLGSWNENSCPGSAFLSPVLWDLAVAGGAALFTGNPYFAPLITGQLNMFKNAQTGGYSATMSDNTGMYTDDNSQALWVFLDAYELSGNKNDLTAAEGIMAMIQTQWVSNGGGVRWDYDGDYLASISQTESALAAVRLYKLTNNNAYLQFSKDCINWVFENLQDPSDHLFFDGKSVSTGQVNNGKLSYTVGTAISTLSYLYSIENDEKWLTLAIQLIQASAQGSGALYSSVGYWNNPLKYLYLLFTGLADFNNFVESPSVTQLQQNITTEVLRNAKYIAEYYQDGNSGFYYDDFTQAPDSVVSKFKSAFPNANTGSNNPPKACSNGKTYSSLLTNSAAARVFYQTWRV